MTRKNKAPRGSVCRWIFFSRILFNCNHIKYLLTTIFFLCFLPGVSLQLCGKSQDTCCGENSEQQLMTVGKSLYDEKLQNSLKTLSVMYKEKAAKFDGKYNIIIIIHARSCRIIVLSTDIMVVGLRRFSKALIDIIVVLSLIIEYYHKKNHS